MQETFHNHWEGPKSSADTPAQTQQTEILDYNALVDRCLGNIELASRLVEKLQTCLPQEIESMEKALSQNDAAQLARIAHRLKGATASVSAQRLNRVVEAIEEYGKAGTLSDIPASLEQLHQEWEQFRIHSTTFLPS